MKKLFFAGAGLLLCFMISCTDSKTTSSTTTTNAEKNRENITSVYRGIESGDMSKMDEFVADDIVDHYHGEVKGRDSVKKMLADMHNHFSNLKMDIIAEATSTNSANDEYHFTLVRMTGTTTDDKFGRPANTAVDETSVDVVRMKDGKAVDHWGFDDPTMMMKMMEMNKGNQPMDKMENKDSAKTY